MDAGGANTWYLLREGFDTYAFDGSKSAIENTRHKLENEFGECRADLRVRDALDLDYEKDSFDGILDNFCICTNKLVNIKSMLSECYSMLKPDGKIYTAGFGFETEGYGQGKEIEKNTYQDIPIGRLQGVGTIHFYDDIEIKRLLVEAGFKNIQTDSNLYTDMGHKVHIWSTIAEK